MKIRMNGFVSQKYYTGLETLFASTAFCGMKELCVKLATGRA